MPNNLSRAHCAAGAGLLQCWQERLQLADSGGFIKESDVWALYPRFAIILAFCHSDRESLRC